MNPPYLTFVYSVSGILWIILSGLLYQYLRKLNFSGEQGVWWIVTTMGGSFVLMSGIMIYQLSRKNRKKESRALKKLKAQRKYINLLFSKSELSLFILNVDGTFRRVNENFARFLGYSEKELKGANFFNLLATEDNPDLGKVRRNLLSREQDTFNIPVSMRGKGGEIAHIRIIGIGLYNDRGMLDMVVVSATDITDERILHKKLKNTYNNFKKLIDNSPDIIWSVNRDYKLIAFNNNYEKVINISSGRKVKSGDSIFLNKGFITSSEEKWKKYYDRAFSGEVFSVEEVDNSSEELRVSEINFSPIKGRKGNVKGVSCCATDVTGRVITEMEKRKSIVEGQESERENISKILHDGVVQTLAAIKMNCNVLLSELPEKNTKIENVKGYTSNAIEQLRNLSHDLKPPELKQGLINGLHAYFQRLNTSEKEFTFNLNIDLCEEDEFSLSRLDQLNLYRIIQEAINNAIKYSEGDTVALNIYCTKPNNSHLIVEVADNGKGFDPHKEGNKGVGLKNMKNRAELEKMEFHIESNKEGTKVKLIKFQEG